MGVAVPILRDKPITIQDALIPYAMVGINMLAPLFVARDVLRTTPFVFLVAIVLILVGLPCSIYFRQRQYHPIALNLLVTIPLLALTWALLRTHPGLQIDWSDPISSAFSHDENLQLEGLLNVVALLSAGRAFLLVTSKELIQTPIPGISIFLISVMAHSGHLSGRSPYNLLCLLLLFLSSLYLFSHQHSLQWFTIHTPMRVQRHLLTWVFIFSLLTFPLIFLLGMRLQPFNMQRMMMRNRHRTSIQPWMMPMLYGRRVGVSLERGIDVGGSNWPTGKQQIMTVTVTRGSTLSLLWRSTTYASYQDGRWETGERAAPEIVPAVAEGGRVVTVYEPPLPPESSRRRLAVDPGIVQACKEDPQFVSSNSVDQHIEMKAPLRGRGAMPIYGAYQISRATFSREFTKVSLAADGGVSISSIDYSEVMPPYEIVSIVKPMPAVLHLKANPALSPDQRRQYLQMPEGEFATRIKAKAEEVIAEHHLNRRDTYNIVRALEAYLGTHYRYTLKPSPPKGNADPLIDFLYTQKQGYCNYFSGSMVMLCRSLGIPARLAVGYATGDPVEGKGQAGQTTYQITSDQAHSWVEVYLPHYGWYTSDPTAGSSEVQSLWGHTWDALTNAVAAVKAVISKLVYAFQHDSRVRGYSNLGLATLLIAAAGLIYWRRERPPALPRRELSPAEARETILHAYQRMHRWMRRWGVSKPDGLTASEFLRDFRGLNEPMGVLVEQLSTLYLQARYGTRPLYDADARQAIRWLQELWEVARTEHRRLQAPDVEA